MAFKKSVETRNAALDAEWALIGPSPQLLIYTGPPPADCSQPDTGTVLVVAILPATPMQPASGGVKSKSGPWQDLLADASGTAGYFRIKNNAGSLTHRQG